jgi:penicillin-binding protein 1C
MKNFKTYWNKYRKYILRIAFLLFITFIIWYILCLPSKLFNDGTSTVLLDRNGSLLGAKIARDGQWRFAPADSVPAKFETCLVEFEDRTFYKHHGISIKGIGRAIIQNIEHKKIVSGGSTITMQLARIMRKNPSRTYFEKILEMILATRIEASYSKQEILGYYAAHAPFGNNVVGLEAASWRYYGKSSNLLSWSECATLAVLPNAPGLIYPGKNHDRLLNKRNRLLKRLYDIKKIDKTTYDLALLEPLPDKPLKLPQLAPHLLERLIKTGYSGKTIKSTIDINLQTKAIQQLQAQSEILQDNKIYNGAIIISSVETGEVLAYVGNTNLTDIDNCGHVDCIDAPRSSGSILKPLLYEKCMEDGKLTPNMILPDIPTHYGSFSPKNFSQQYNGAIPANMALARSLNIPMVNLLNEYGLEKFYYDLKKYGFTTLNKPARYYGLSLILGGAEVKLFDLNQVYTQMAQELAYDEAAPISIVLDSKEKKIQTNTAKSDRACIYSTFEAMIEVNRPDDEGNWRVFSSSQKIAWKTGTSFGFRDAWAVGITPDYVVSVWVGNADGEGRPGLTGIKAAAPLMFNMFSQLPKSESWFLTPRSEQCQINICKESGYRASDLCENTETVWVPKTCLNTTACPYHQVVHLTKDGKYRIDSESESVYNMKHVSWFVLPPLVEKYYKVNHPNYKVLPEYRPGCLAKISDKAIAIIYPKPNSKIYVPIEIDGSKGRTVFEATHKNTSAKIFWHLDDEYIGETKEIHQIALNPPVGKHKLLLIDESGINVSLKFEVVEREN